MFRFDPLEPGLVLKSKIDDFIQSRPLKMSAFNPLEPGPALNAKNDDFI